MREAEYSGKRNVILDAATSLVYSKGYESMTIQDILVSLKISRGALYHYFSSKEDLLEALIERSAGGLEHSLRAIVQDPELSAVQKIQGYFDLSTQWKSSQRDLLASALRNWHSDENALFRQKMAAKSRQYVPRFLEPIIRQGIEERVFDTPHPAEVAVIFAGMTLTLSDCLIDLMLAPGPAQESFERAQALLDAYFDSLERMLGAPAGSFRAIDLGVFKDWFASEGR